MIQEILVLDLHNTSNLVKKIDCNTKFDDIEKKLCDHDKYITTQEF